MHQAYSTMLLTSKSQECCFLCTLSLTRFNVSKHKLPSYAQLTIHFLFFVLLSSSPNT